MVGILRMAKAATTYFTARMDLSDRGATAVEYGMIVALIAAVIVVTVGLVGQDTLEGFDTVENNIGGDDGGG